jgi:hypothetical protein
MAVSSNGTSTATIETLTAQVKTLQVGNRQITLGVVKQLDRNYYINLDPMGRVRSGRKDYPRETESTTEVVGRNKTTGALEWAYAPRGTWPMETDEWRHWSGHMRKQGVKGNAHVVAKYGEKELTWHVPNYLACPLRNPHRYQTDRDNKPDEYDPVERWLYAEWEYHQQRGDFCDMDALREEWWSCANHNLGAYYMVENMRAEAEKLPLIVLAGLK